MARYAFKDWDSVLASIGHGGLKEGQVINKMLDEKAKKQKKEVTDKAILDGIEEMTGKAPENKKMCIRDRRNSDRCGSERKASGDGNPKLPDCRRDGKPAA